MRIPANELKAEFKKILMSRGFDDTNADEAAQEYKGGIVVPDDGDVIDL